MTSPIFSRSKQLMFGQVREDAEVDRFLLSQIVSPQRAFVIASGGCTAFSLLAHGSIKVDAVDISEAQIALVEAKLSMFKMLGFEVSRDACKADATAAYKQVRNSLSANSRDILDACPADLERGLNNAGWVDKRMQQITNLFFTFIHSRATTEKLLSMCNVSEQLAFYNQHWSNWQWKLGLNVAFSRQFMTIAHGADAKRLIPSDFSQVMKRRIVRGLTEVSACSNPYVWQTFLARYNDSEEAVPPYLQKRRWDEMSKNLDNLTTTCAGSIEWLQKQADDSIDYFGLSNILELLPADYAVSVQKEILRCARNNAIVCVRGIFPRETLVFTLEPELNRKLVVESNLKAEAEKMDRSLFCNFYQIFRCVASKALSIAAILFAFFAISAADAAQHDANIESNGLFHDQGAVFVNSSEPDFGTPMSVRFRAFNGDLTAATVKYFDSGDRAFHNLPMSKEAVKPESVFEYWQATIPASSSKKFYRFCLRDGASTAWYNARGATQSEPSEGDFFIVPGFKTPDWLKNGIIYQIYPDRFYNGDTKNDVTTGQYKHGAISSSQRQWGESPLPKEGEDRSFTFYGGDLQGIISKLDYIRTSVGADIVYLNPIFKAPSNHKYDTSDYDVVDPAFGTNESLIQLSNSLHNVLNGQRGYLILDGVFNHTGDGHKWFAKYDAVPGVVGAYQSQKSLFSSYYNFKKWPKDYAHFMIYDSLPKLNFGSQVLRNAIYQSPNSVALRYLKPPYNIDGWRLDAPKYADANGLDGSDKFNHVIWHQFRDAVKGANKSAAIIGENWENASSWTAGGDQWDSVTNFNAFTAPVSQWITGKKLDDTKAPLSTSEFERMLRLTRADYPTNVQQALSNHLSNHDISRFAQRADGDLSETNLALIFQMTYVGTPTIYYGDEYGMMGAGDPDCRRTFDWNKATSDNKAISLTHHLISIRNKYSALRTGSFMCLKKDDTNDVFVYGRVDRQHQIAVVLNNSSAEKTVDVPVRMLELTDNANVRDELSGKTYQVHSGMVTVTVPGHYGAILVH